MAHPKMDLTRDTSNIGKELVSGPAVQTLLTSRMTAPASGDLIQINSNASPTRRGVSATSEAIDVGDDAMVGARAA
jgi:hypothetical protein